jgi:excisionase family DNA binding protein
MKTKLSENVKVAKAAEILGTSRGTVRAWIEARKIPMKNPANGFRRVKRVKLEQFLEFVDRVVVPAVHPR